jgi:hypothetical protein
MNVVRTLIFTGLMAGLAVAAHSDPHWTASIGTGHATANTASAPKPSASTPTTRKAAPHWSAEIGTGRAAADSAAAPPIESPTMANATACAP